MCLVMFVISIVSMAIVIGVFSSSIVIPCSIVSILSWRVQNKHYMDHSCHHITESQRKSPSTHFHIDILIKWTHQTIQVRQPVMWLGDWQCPIVGNVDKVYNPVYLPLVVYLMYHIPLVVIILIISFVIIFLILVVVVIVVVFIPLTNTS